MARARLCQCSHRLSDHLAENLPSRIEEGLATDAVLLTGIVSSCTRCDCPQFTLAESHKARAQGGDMPKPPATRLYLGKKHLEVMHIALQQLQDDSLTPRQRAAVRMIESLTDPTPAGRAHRDWWVKMREKVVRVHGAIPLPSPAPGASAKRIARQLGRMLT